jgi:hypothetical protein
MNSIHRSALFVTGACLTVLLTTTAADASPWDKKTKLTVNETIEVPGATLKPGKYVMKLADSQSNRHIVQFFNEDETQVLSTVLAIPNSQMKPAEETKLSFYETPSGEPPALRAWFYPGDTFGQEFAYPEKDAREIAKASKRHVLAISDDSKSDKDSLRGAEISAIDPEGNKTDPKTSMSKNVESDRQRQSTRASSRNLATTEEVKEEGTQTSAAREQRESPDRTSTPRGTTTTERSTADRTSATDRTSDADRTSATDRTTATTTDRSRSATSAAAQRDRSSEERTVAQARPPQDPRTEEERERSRTSVTSGEADRQADPSTRLPDTASPAPWMGLIGLLSLGAAIGMRRLSS